MIRTTSSILTRPDAEIYYEVTGEGPAVVFAHGLGGNHVSWWQQVPYFAPRFTCVAFAHRGFAPSRTAGGQPDPARYGDDLAALIDHLGLADVRLVAQSMGGWTCLDYTLRHPDRVKALVLAATAGGADPHSFPPAGRANVLGWMAAHASAGQDLFHRGIHPAAGERMAREQPALHFLYREIDQLGGPLDKMALLAKLKAASTVPLSKLEALRVPVLLISGDEDVVFAPPALEALASAIPGARLARVPEAGHSVYFERAAEFNALLDGIL